MEKEPQPESLATVTIKPEYAPSEVYSSEPPPAYHRHQSTAVHVARIIAITVVVVSIIFGGFMLASSYISANGCRQHELELQLLSETADRLQPEALVQVDPQQHQAQADPLVSDESKSTNDVHDNGLHQLASDVNSDNNDSNNNESSESEENNVNTNNVAIKVPLQIDFDDLMSTLMERNQKSKLNCIVDKKRADEIIDHQAKTAQLPFGINIRTDPRFEHISGERIAIICESGNVQKISPPADDQEETIMIQPVMIPIPPQQFQTHMAQMMPQQLQAQLSNVQQPPFFPQEMMARRPNVEQRPYFRGHMSDNMMPPRPQPYQNVEQRSPYFTGHMNDMRMSRPQASEHRPMYFQEEMREGLVPPRPQPVQNAEPQQLYFQQQLRDGMNEESRPEPSENVAEVTENSVDQRPQPSLPNPLIHHIIQQIINQRMQAEKQNDMQQESNDVRSTPSQFEVPPAMDRLPIPVEILRQINRLPGNRGVIVAVSEQEPEERSGEVQIVRQEPRQNAQEMNGKQVYQEPVAVMQEQNQEASSEETRPHFVQPRSVE